MVTQQLKRIALDNKLFLIDPAMFGPDSAWAASGRVAVMGGSGITVGTMIPLGDGRWVGVPGAFPSIVGEPSKVFEFLGQFGCMQTFPVSVGFDRGQVAPLERNEGTILTALKGVAHKFVGGQVEGILVGSACWDR